jgi:hypothetical protein
MQKYFLPSNPTLAPHTVVLQLTPSDDLGGFGEHRFDEYNSFHPQSALGYLPPQLFRERISAT